MTTRPSPGSHTPLVYRLEPPIKHYAWGSTTLLAELTGTEPTGAPEAEMWFGTHPTMPTRLTNHAATLADLVDLPFLIKLLAAGQPLSIQAHPTIPQAQAGFASEHAAGLPLDDPQRTYRDANHKPELLVALTDFTALAGFRDPAATAQTFHTLADLADDTPQLADTLKAMADQLAAGQIQKVFDQLIDPSGTFWQPNAWTKHIFTTLANTDHHDQHLTTALAAATIHPDDPGALITLLMNRVQLRPGEAIFLPDGTIHAYVSGLGVEVMATSDNVIRGGLTVKHIDITELGRVVSYEPSPPPYIQPAITNIDDVMVTCFTPPVADFALTRYDLPPGTQLVITVETPRIAVCTHGTGTLLTRPTDQMELAAGQGLYLPAHGQELTLCTSAAAMTVFIASQP